MEEMGVESNFGIEFERDPDGEIHSFCSWNEPYSHNFIEDLSDPIIHGPYGEVTNIGLHAATAMILHPENNNTVKGRAWRNEVAHTDVDVVVAQNANDRFKSCHSLVGVDHFIHPGGADHRASLVGMV